jgi:hypothetical protein
MLRSPLKIVSPPLTVSQQELSAATEALVTARRELETAQAALARLEAPARLREEAAATLATLTTQHGEAVHLWYSAGCIGPRPEVPGEMIDAERRVGELSKDFASVVIGLERAQETVQTAVQKYSARSPAPRQSPLGGRPQRRAAGR